MLTSARCSRSLLTPWGSYLTTSGATGGRAAQPEISWHAVACTGPFSADCTANRGGDTPADIQRTESRQSIDGVQCSLWSALSCQQEVKASERSPLPRRTPLYPLWNGVLPWRGARGRAGCASRKEQVKPDPGGRLG